MNRGTNFDNYNLNGSGIFGKKQKTNYSNKLPSGQTVTSEHMALLESLGENNKLKEEMSKLKKEVEECKNRKPSLPPKPTPTPTPTPIPTPKPVLPPKPMLPPKPVPISTTMPFTIPVATAQTLILKKSSHKKVFIFDFDCTITYTHWFYYLHSFDEWKIKYLYANPQYKKVNESQKATVINKLKDTSNKIVNLLLSDYANNDLSPNTIAQLNKLTSTEHYSIILNYIMGGVIRKNAICSLIKTLTNNGYEVVIASRGLYIDIKALLLLLRFDGIKEINAKKNCKSRDPSSCNYISKPDYIKTLYNQGYTTIRYVDDTIEEHKELIKNFDKKVFNPDYKFYGKTNDAYTVDINLVADGYGLTQDNINVILVDNKIINKVNCIKTNAKRTQAIKPTTTNTKAVIFNLNHTIIAVTWDNFLSNINSRYPCENEIRKYFSSKKVQDLMNRPRDDAALMENISLYDNEQNFTNQTIKTIMECILGPNAEKRYMAIKEMLKYFKNNGYDSYLMVRGDYNYMILLLHLFDLYDHALDPNRTINFSQKKGPFTSLIDNDKIIAKRLTAQTKDENYQDNFLNQLKKTSYKEIYFVDALTDGILAKTVNTMPRSIKTKLYSSNIGLKENGSGLSPENIQKLLTYINQQKGGYDEEAYYQKYLKYKKKYMILKNYK
jgi:hypothetical protein